MASLIYFKDGPHSQAFNVTEQEPGASEVIVKTDWHKF